MRAVKTEETKIYKDGFRHELNSVVHDGITSYVRRAQLQDMRNVCVLAKEKV